MKAIYKISLLLVVTGTMMGCRDYVEVEQYNTRTLKYTEDFQYLLNNFNIFGPISHQPVFSSDDLILADGSYQNNILEYTYLPYTWAEQYFADQQQDMGWNNLYKQIYTANEIIGGVMESEDGNERKKRQLLAEAKVHRAYAYYMLVNQYGEIYDPQTSAQAVGVPLLLRADNLLPRLDRASVQDIYTQVVTDLEEALPDLPERADNNRHPDKPAVHAILANVYLHMRKFEDAGKHAEEAIQSDHQLFDLPIFASETSAIYPRMLDHPETFLSKKTQQQYDEQLNPELISLFDEKDLRLSTYTKPTQNSSMPADALVSRKNEFSGEASVRTVEVGPTLPEVILIRAEVQARSGQYKEAMQTVNELRQHRFHLADFQPLEATNADQALNSIVEERRRELFATGKRWFDQRRFNLDPTLARTFVRTFRGETFTLEINSKRFIYPIAQYYLDLNPEIGQSPR